MLICTIILLGGLGGYRYSNPYKPNFYKVIGNDPSDNLVLLRRSCSRLMQEMREQATDSEEEELALPQEQEDACETFKKRMRVQYYNTSGPEYLRCKTCLNDWDYFLHTQVGFVVTWIISAFLITMIISNTSTRMSSILIPVLIAMPCLLIFQLSLYFFTGPISYESFVNFELIRISVEVFWASYGLLVIYCAFVGGDYRTDREIMINISKLNDMFYHHTICLLTPHQVPFESESLRKKFKEPLKKAHAFYAAMEKNPQIFKAYLHGFMRTTEVKSGALRSLHIPDLE